MASNSRVAFILPLTTLQGTIGVGSDADVVLWDAKREVTITHDLIRDGVDHTPWEGFKVVGWPVLTMSRGRVVHRDEDVVSVGEPGWGNLLARGPYPFIDPTGHRFDS
jgi:dihydropyrimidinase